MLAEDKLVFETDVAKWYINDMTKLLDELLYEDTDVKLYGKEQIIFSNLKSYLVKTTDGYNPYIIVDNNEGCPIYASQSFEAVCFHIDAMRASRRL